MAFQTVHTLILFSQPLSERAVSWLLSFFFTDAHETKMRQGARPSWWKRCKKTFPLAIIWRSVVQPSPPDVDSEGNVSLICTRRQTAYVLEAALNVCWGAPTNRRRWKRLCRHAFLSNMKRKPPGPIQAVQNENVNCKWRQNKEPWRTLSVGLCLFNPIFKCPMLKLQ